ncbi:hypothetical protein Tco_0323804 [Tanacetum coccineum]
MPRITIRAIRRIRAGACNRRYAQWRSRFLRYIDTRPNGDALRKCILEGPYTPTIVIILAVPAMDNSSAVPKRTTVETILNIQLMKCGKRSKGYNKVNHSTFKMSRQTYFGSLDNSPLTMEKQLSHITQALLPTKSQATTRPKGKETAKPVTPPSESASEEDSDPEQAHKDKEMQNNLTLIAKYFKNLYKPTNNNLRTSSNPKNKNVDTTSRYKNDNQSGHVSIAGNSEKGVPLHAELSDWLAWDKDEELDEQELDATLLLMEKIPGESVPEQSRLPPLEVDTPLS